MRIAVNSFYVKKYLLQKYSVKDSTDVSLNSELRNYPHRFFILNDTINNYDYVIETSITNDSMNIQAWGLSLSSVYDYDRMKWIYDRDSLRPQMLKNFKYFFEKNVLQPTAAKYSGKVNDTCLFLQGKPLSEILEID